MSAQLAEPGLFDPDALAAVSKTANLSDDGVYRYTLTRNWDPSLPVVVWVMLNPSTADADTDDRTIGRCIRFARDWGYGGIVVVNLYAFRATKPEKMLAAPDPVGPANDATLAQVLAAASRTDSPVVAAWGVNGDPARVAAVLTLPHADRLMCVGTTKDGHPRHPLYVLGSATPIPWTPPT